MEAISTPKFDLAQELAQYSRKEQRQIFRAARHLSKFMELTEEYEDLPENVKEGNEMLAELEQEINEEKDNGKDSDNKTTG